MLNKAMEKKIADGDAIDLKSYNRADSPYGSYFIPENSLAWRKIQEGGFDFCDSSTEEWIWSIGKRRSDGSTFASTDTIFYQQPGYDCLWLR